MVLVGAGPGQAGLLTLAGARWLAKAEVVVHDRLVGPELLELAAKTAERIYVGKAPGGLGPTQQQINELLIERCLAGQLVVRLKGGDGMVFGRGGEEAEALAAAGCTFRIVPGVTAGIAAPAFAGIPLTDRRLAATAALVTGHEDPTRDPAAIDWQALTKIDTVVFYMGVENLPLIAERLMAAGRAGLTPVAVIQNASTPRQRTIVGTLQTISDQARAAEISRPAVIVVGRVVEMRQRLAWWEKLPLFGQTVLVTRQQPQAAELAEELRELGAEAIEAPAVMIVPPDDHAPLDSAIRRIRDFDWLVATSANGARHLLARMAQLGLDARGLAGVKIAAVGPATAEAFRQHFVVPDLVPGQYTTESLARALTAAGPLEGRGVLLTRSDIATAPLPKMLRQAGAAVEEVAAYRTVRPAALPAAALDALQQNRVDWITFCSSATVGNFLALIDGHRIDLSGIALAAIGPVTAEAIKAAGLTPAVVADPHTVDGLLDAIVAFAR